MAGILHAVFGLLVGLVAWQLAGGRDGKKRFSLGLVVIFAINNYIGPDLGTVIRGIGNALGSDTIVRLGNSVHSYFGWIVFTFFWAPVWHVIFVHLERARVRRELAAGTAGSFTDTVVHGFSDVFRAVLAGGFMHHFVDAVSHYRYTPPVIRGSVALIVPHTPGLFVAYAVLAGIVAGIWVVHQLARARVGFAGLARQVRRSLWSPQAAWILGSAAIAAGTVAIIYGAQAAIGMAGDPLVATIRLDMAALLATAQLYTGSATWWLGAWSAAFLVVFPIAYAKRLVTRRGHRVDLIVVLGYIGMIVLGYVLQPVIGNVSGTEADSGALIHLWALLIFPLALLASINHRGTPASVPEPLAPAGGA